MNIGDIVKYSGVNGLHVVSALGRLDLDQVLIYPFGVYVSKSFCQVAITAQQLKGEVWEICGEQVSPDGLSECQQKRWEWLCGRTYFCEMLLSDDMAQFEFEKDEWAQQVIDMVQETDHSREIQS